MKSRRLRGLVAFTLVAGHRCRLLFTTGMGTFQRGIDSGGSLPLGALCMMLGAHNAMARPSAWALRSSLSFLGQKCCKAPGHAPSLGSSDFSRGVEKAGPPPTANRAVLHAPLRAAPITAGTPPRERRAFRHRRETRWSASRRTTRCLGRRSRLQCPLSGFPVFCLLCPIGLTFATLIGLWQLFTLNETGWDLIIFPLILLAEVPVLRKMHGDLPGERPASLISSTNRTCPSVDPRACLAQPRHRPHGLRTPGPEQPDPHSPSIPECSKCRECADLCPAKAISFPLVRPREGARGTLREKPRGRIYRKPSSVRISISFPFTC